jgi:hypothetical protein
MQILLSVFRTRLFFFFSTLILLSNHSFSQKADSARPLRLFLIGNSFSQNATQFLPQIVKEAGRSLVIGRAELGGCPLDRHWNLAELNRKDTADPKGKPYSGKSLRQLLSNGKWDVVTIQQYSLYSSNVQTYQPYAKNLVDLIRSLQPDAEIVFHQTWAYRTDSRDFGQTGDNTSAKSAEEMWQKSRAAYAAVATQLGGLAIIPVGNAFWAVNSDKRFAFKTDPSFNDKTAVYPDLPKEENSLHVGYSWTADKKLNFDAHHANQAGCYLGALVWYRFLFDGDPRKVNFKPEKVSAEFATFLKQTAATTEISQTKKKR